MSLVLFDVVMLLIAVLLVAGIAALLCYRVSACIRLFEWSRGLKDPRLGTPLTLVVIDGRLFLDALHPEARSLLSLIRLQATRSLEETETRAVQDAPPTGTSSNGLQ